MIETLIGGGLLFIIGLLVGRNVGRHEGQRATLLYMATVSHVQNIMHTIHEKHGIVDEVRDALRASGIELQRTRIQR